MNVPKLETRAKQRKTPWRAVRLARTAGPTAPSDEDYSYEFFLVVRPTATDRGRLVRQWSFPREEVARTVPSGLAEKLRAEYAGAELEKRLEQQKGLYVHGFLRFDEQSKTATVTITGLVRPFEERVDLSGELPPAD